MAGRLVLCLFVLFFLVVNGCDEASEHESPAPAEGDASEAESPPAAEGDASEAESPAAEEGDASEAESPAAELSGCPTDTNENVIYYNTGDSTEGSPFESNLALAYENLLATNLDNSPNQVKSGDEPDAVYGYAACFGGDCGACLATCKDYFVQVAPLSVGARVCLKSGSDACYLRYENYSF